jgi:hypothetical protein
MRRSPVAEGWFHRIYRIYKMFRIHLENPVNPVKLPFRKAITER